jgi:hypothetical protein
LALAESALSKAVSPDGIGIATALQIKTLRGSAYSLAKAGDVIMAAHNAYIAEGGIAARLLPRLISRLQDNVL